MPEIDPVVATLMFAADGAAVDTMTSVAVANEVAWVNHVVGYALVALHACTR